MELEKLFKSRKKDYSIWENEISDNVLSEADEKLLKKLIARGNDTGRIRYEYTDSDSILSKMGLVALDNEHLNNAGKVLMSRNKPVILKLATFATNTKETFTRLNHFEGNTEEECKQVAEQQGCDEHLVVKDKE